MAKKNKDKTSEISDKWYVVVYPADKLVSVCHESDFNLLDERIEKVSEHDEIQEATDAHRSYAKENDLTPQY